MLRSHVGASRSAGGEVEKNKIVNLRIKLQNPFLLVGQGFLVGAVLFFAVSVPTEQARSAPVDEGPLQVETGAAL